MLDIGLATERTEIVEFFVLFKNSVGSAANSFRNDAMHAFADKANVGDLHIAQIGFGGDVFLQPGSEWFAEAVSEGGKGNRERYEQESPTGGFGTS